MQNNGALHFLLKTIGWYHKPSENRTREETERARTPKLESPAETSPSRYGLPTEPNRRFADLRSMAASDLAAPIVELYAEETTQPDINKGKTLWYECNDGKVEKELNSMLERIHAEDYLFPIATGICSTGNEFQRILWSREEGVQQIVGVPQDMVARLWHPTTRKLLGFRWNGQEPHDPMYTNAPDVFAPWDFLHFRRIYDSSTEYGRGLLDHLYPVWKKLELSTDQMVLYRLHTMPNRFALNIDIGNADFTDGMEQAHAWRAFMRQQMGMDSQNPGAVGLQSRFDPAAIDSFLIFPKRGAEDGSSIETLAGDKDVPDVMDIEQLEKQFLGGARIPRAYLGREENSGLAQASLVSQDIRFARMVRVLRRPIVAGFFRLAQLHLSYKGIDPSLYKITVKMSRISSIEEEVNIASMEKQAALAGDIANLCQMLEIPNAQIMDLVFREYLSVPRYFLDVAKLTAGVNAAIGGNLEGGPGGGGMMGGGMGGGGMDAGLDMGGDMGMGDLDDLGSMDAEGGGGGGEVPDDDTLVAGGARRNNLMERQERQKRAKKLKTRQDRRRYETSERDGAELHDALRHISESVKAGKLQESTDGPLREEVRREARKTMEAKVRDLAEIGMSGRVSLVEGYTPADPVPKGLRESIAKHCILKAPHLELTETAPQTVPEGGLEAPHPGVSAVQAVREARKKQQAKARAEKAGRQ